MAARSQGESHAARAEGRPVDGLRVDRLLICSVLLEPRRWSAERPPLVRASVWAEAASGSFDGWELWEDHWLHAEAAERRALQDGPLPVVILSSYASFGAAGRDSRARTLETVRALRPAAVKFNFPRDAAEMPGAAEALRRFADELPAGCRLLCECHAGTAVDSPDRLMEWQERAVLPDFGLIVHPFTQPSGELDRWFALFGGRVGHLHLQASREGRRTLLRSLGTAAEEARDVLRRRRFAGTVSVEFTAGVAEAGERADVLFRHAVDDGAWFRNQFLCSS